MLGPTLTRNRLEQFRRSGPGTDPELPGIVGKVHWTFVITAASTDDEINVEGPGGLTNAVIQVEK